MWVKLTSASNVLFCLLLMRNQKSQFNSLQLIGSVDALISIAYISIQTHMMPHVKSNINKATSVKAGQTMQNTQSSQLSLWTLFRLR